MAYEYTLGGTFTTSEGIDFTREGYGAMQLAGPRVWGPPADRDERSGYCAPRWRPA